MNVAEYEEEEDDRHQTVQEVRELSTLGHLRRAFLSTAPGADLFRRADGSAANPAVPVIFVNHGAERP